MKAILVLFFVFVVVAIITLLPGAIAALHSVQTVGGVLP